MSPEVRDFHHALIYACQGHRASALGRHGSGPPVPASLNARRMERVLATATGVIHVGANVGQEREAYARRGFNVLWVEPIPDVFTALKQNIEGLPKQRALQALVADVDGCHRTLHVANNEGASSSIFDLGQHRDVWPGIDYVRDVVLDTATLPALLRDHAEDVSRLRPDHRHAGFGIAHSAWRGHAARSFSIHPGRGGGFPLIRRRCATLWHYRLSPLTRL